MGNLADVLKKSEKTYGKGIMKIGVECLDMERLPTGIFPLDLSLGGGFPIGKISIIYGPESSGKTNIALKLIANFQRMYPHLHCVFVDVENSFDPGWATIMGVDVAKLVHVLPTYAEQAVDIVEAMLHSDDVGLIVVDSIAALTTSHELDSSAEKAIVGGSALVVGKLARKAIQAMVVANQSENYPTLVCINQIRFKIGVMYGDPETQPGGKPLLFAASMILRCYGKSVIDKAVSGAMPTYKETSTILKKYKVPVVSINSSYQMILIPHKGHKIGGTDDFNTLSSYAKNFGMLAKSEDKAGGWLFMGVVYPTLIAIKEELISNVTFADEVRKEIIMMALADSTGLSSELEEQDEA